MRPGRASRADDVSSNAIPTSSQLNQIKSFRDMASVAPGAEATSVDIIFSMAAAAGGRKINFSLHGCPVTGNAGETLVGAVQDIVRLLAVVEGPQGPAIWVMAVAAVGPEALAVLVVTPVAIDACIGSILVSGREVTLLTLDYGMQPNQGEIRQVVVEKYLPAPRLLVVAVAASLSFLALVDVVIRMTAVAIRSQLFPVFFRHMTTAAQHFVVGPTQSKLGIPVMVEGDLFPTGLDMTLRTIRPKSALV